PRSLAGTLPVAPREWGVQKWHTAIWAESDGVIRGGGIVDHSVPGEEGWDIECVGFSGILKDQPYAGDSGNDWTEVDPLEVVRYSWAHSQSYPVVDLGVIVDDTAPPVRIGEEHSVAVWTEQAGSDTTSDEGPIRLNWWDVH